MVKQMTPEQPLPEESTPAAPMKFLLETVVRYQNQALSQSWCKRPCHTDDDSLPGDSKAFLAQLLAAPPTGKPLKRCATSFDPRSGGTGIWLGATANPPRNGEPSHNLFGVKASGNWKGPVTGNHHD